MDPPLNQAAGGFAGPGSVTFSDSSEDSILASEAGSFSVEGSFAPADGGALDPSTVLYLYIFDETSSDNSGASRGVAAVDPDTGAFTTAVTDAPVGSSTLVLSFVLGGALPTTTSGSSSGSRRGLRSGKGGGASRNEARRLFSVSGLRSVFTAPVVNPNSCDNALAITLEWFDGDSDVDLWVNEPGGQDVGFSSPLGVSVVFLIVLCVVTAEPPLFYQNISSGCGRRCPWWHTLRGNVCAPAAVALPIPYWCAGRCGSSKDHNDVSSRVVATTSQQFTMSLAMRIG